MHRLCAATITCVLQLIGQVLVRFKLPLYVHLSSSSIQVDAFILTCICVWQIVSGMWVDFVRANSGQEYGWHLICSWLQVQEVT
jgi:hypothetical protein